MPVSKAIIVTGRVQGVGYRAACVSEAIRLGIAGYVKNQSDGSVYVLAQGDVSNIDELIRWCARGPLFASVDRVSVTETETVVVTDFTIRRG